MKKSCFQLLFFLVFLQNSIAQQFHFKLNFNQKDTAAFQASLASNYLSERAITRKALHNIPIEINDYPIQPDYLDSLRKIASIRSTSKWFNYAVVATMDSNDINLFKSISFVKSTEYIGKSSLPLIRTSSIQKENEVLDLNYNRSEPGIAQVNGNFLHNAGFLGQGILIAILDAGFVNVDQLSIFDSLRISNRILATRNVIYKNANVYQSDNHGTQVLSVLAAEKEGELIGTAPKAEYALILTEDVRVEEPIEEYYWIEGMEYADSIGADLVNSSLGYNTFDISVFDHQITDLFSGNVLLSNAANLAFEKGILVFNSAGNEGNSAWEKLLFPADASKIITVGAVDLQGNKANFSSVGVSSSGIIKPNIAALGVQVSVSSAEGFYNTNNGTSFSCPLIAGLSACLWQAFPEKSNDSLKLMIEASSSQYHQPDFLIGYGIPNFQFAFEKQTNSSLIIDKPEVLFYPNPNRGDYLTIRCFHCEGPIKINVLSATGQSVYQENLISSSSNETTIFFPSKLPKGVYFIEIQSNDLAETKIIIID